MINSIRFHRAYFVILFVLSILCVFSLIWWWLYITSPIDSNSTSTQSFEFDIPVGQSASQVANRLSAAGLIKSTLPFKLIVRLEHRTIQAGKYQLSPTQSLQGIITELENGRNDIIVTLLEGWRREEMAQELNRSINSQGGSFDPNKFLLLTSGLEGQLYPDTYSFPASYTTSQIVSILRNNFQAKVVSAYRQNIADSPYTLNQIITIASLVEREARESQDRPIVAAIILRRLAQDWPLQIDATVQYALGYQQNEKDWWKQTLTQQDLALVSPYNTYKNLGLPPAPIANPGPSSIKAVLYPEATDYWFYLTGKNGQMYYAKNLAGHQQNIAAHLR